MEDDFSLETVFLFESYFHMIHFSFCFGHFHGIFFFFFFDKKKNAMKMTPSNLAYCRDKCIRGGAVFYKHLFLVYCGN